MKIQFLGQNCFLLQHNGVNILTDPFYNYQKSESGFDISKEKIDYLLITHAHQDHIADVEEVLKNHPNATIIGQPEICGYFNHPNCIDLNIGGSTHINGLKISMVNALHTSSFPNGAYGGNPAGYVLSVENKNIYLAGDTGVMAEMELIGKIHGSIDLAILPIGGHYTMDAEQASFASAELIKTKRVLGCHFDTFPPITIDHNQAKNHFSKRNIELIIPQLGEEIYL